MLFLGGTSAIGKKWGLLLLLLLLIFFIGRGGGDKIGEAF